MTIFGFNTDIKFGDTIYHVQSEERRHDSLLQTQVFVRGRCIGKHSNSYSYLQQGSNRDDSAIDESKAHELLKEQHRTIVEAIRSGRLEEVLSQPAAPANPPANILPPPIPTTPDAGHEAGTPPIVPLKPAEPTLELKFINPESTLDRGAAIFRFAVTEEGTAVSGAKIVCRLMASLPDGTEAHPVYAQALTSDEGLAVVSFELLEATLHQASLLVQVSHDGKLATRKFRLKGK